MGKLNLRFYIETESILECESAVDTISDLTSISYGKDAVSIKQYWKIEQYMEVELSIELQSLTEVQFREFTTCFSTDWEHEKLGNELSAMWSYEATNLHRLEKIRWMLLTFLPTNAVSCIE